jgi:hypothetical protein
MIPFVIAYPKFSLFVLSGPVHFGDLFISPEVGFRLGRDVLGG